jgi:Tn3 transposase DDE domain
LTPLEEQPEPPNIVGLTATLVQRWPMTNLLDILKETELRVSFTEAFRAIGAREVLNPEVLQRRLLLCLYGLGTNAGSSGRFSTDDSGFGFMVYGNYHTRVWLDEAFDPVPDD